MRKRYVALVSALALTLAACGEDDPVAGDDTTTTPSGETSTAEPFDRSILGSFAPLPTVVEPTAYAMTDEIVDLGRMLFYETRLSISQEMSCNSCHLLDNFGVDGLQFSLGHEGIPVGRNSPTVYNAALHAAQFLDGREPDVEAQAKGPILAGGEMGMPNPEYVVSVLKTIPGYVDLFITAFPDDDDAVNYDNVGTAIGAFERGLLTPGRFDAFLDGDDDALTDQEKRGLQSFVSNGCNSCHFGPALGGMSFAKIGQIKDFPDVTDPGRFDITGDPLDRNKFKVPGLRNVAETGPYLHDGRVETLEEMVSIMAEYQLGKILTDDEIADIVAFLKALTGEVPTEYIQVPTFPESGPDTPGPYDPASGVSPGD